MRLEVQIGESEPVIYLIDQDVYLGTKDSNDIVIKSSEISGKHLKISVLNNVWYLTDLGSTNGTFIKDERLVPGRRTEFPIGEVVMLGHQVSLRLLAKLSREKNQEIEMKTGAAANGSSPNSMGASPTTQKPAGLTASEKTRVISLKEMQRAQRAREIKKKQKIIEKRREESKRLRAEKNALKRVSVIASGWLVAGIILQMAWKHVPNMMKKAYAPQKIAVDRVLIHGSSDDQQDSLRIPAEKMNVRPLLLGALKKNKCTTKLENIFCSKLEQFNHANSGVIELESDLAFYLEEKPWLDKARQFMLEHHPLKDLSPEERVIDEEALKKLAIILLMRESLGKTTPESFRPRIFYLVLYSVDADVALASAFKSDLLAQFSYKFDLEMEKLKDSHALNFTNNLSGFINLIP